MTISDSEQKAEEVALKRQVVFQPNQRTLCGAFDSLWRNGDTPDEKTCWRLVFKLATLLRRAMLDIKQAPIALLIKSSSKDLRLKRTSAISDDSARESRNRAFGEVLTFILGEIGAVANVASGV